MTLFSIKVMAIPESIRLRFQCIPCSDTSKKVMDRVQVHLLPKPNRIFLTGEITGFPLKIKVATAGIDGSNGLLSQFDRELKEDFGITATWSPAMEDSVPKKRSWTVEPNDFQKEERYALRVFRDAVVMEADTLHGLFNGFQTLRQLLLTNPVHHINGRKAILVPRLEIEDWPALQIRGVADDVSRGQIPTVESAKEFIRNISRFKNNFYAFYMEDVFLCSKHPKIGKDRGAFTAAELRQIDEYARSRFVNLIPILETLTHWDNILTTPEYRDFGEFPGAQCASLANKGVYQLLSDIIGELSPCFSSRIFHMGCDESFDLGHGQSRKLVENMGLDEALLEAYRKVYGIAKKNGNRTVIMYHDAVADHPLLLKKLPRDLIFMYWDYKPKKPSKFSKKIRKIVDAGFRVIVSPSMQVCTRHFPDYLTATENAINIIEAAKNAAREESSKRSEVKPGKKMTSWQTSILGELNSTWGNQYYENLRANYIYGAIFSGSASWTQNAMTMEDMVLEIGYVLFGLETKKDALDFSEFFLRLCEMSDYYRGKIKTNQQEFFTYLYRHPFRTSEPTPNVKDYRSLMNESQAVLNILAGLKSKIRTNRDFLPYLRFGAEIALLLAEKDEMTVSINKQLKEFMPRTDDTIPKSVKHVCQQKVAKFLKHARKLCKEYETLWLRCAKRPNLDDIIARFKQMLRFCDQKINQLAHNIAFDSPFLQSAYIWSYEKYSKPETRYFRKAFTIQGKPTKAKVQAIVGNHGKIYVNGHLAGEVFSRWSQSIMVLKNDVQILDVTPYLVEGKNVIGVEANHHQESVAFTNIYMQYETVIGKRVKSRGEVISDGTWVFQKAPRVGAELYVDSNWTKPDFAADSPKWKPVKVIGLPPKINYDLYKTDLLNNEQSYPEEFFGYLSYLFYEMLFTNGKRIAGIARRITPFILKHIIGLK